MGTFWYCWNWDRLPAIWSAIHITTSWAFTNVSIQTDHWHPAAVFLTYIHYWSQLWSLINLTATELMIGLREGFFATVHDDSSVSSPLAFKSDKHSHHSSIRWPKSSHSAAEAGILISSNTIPDLRDFKGKYGDTGTTMGLKVEFELRGSGGRWGSESRDTRTSRGIPWKGEKIGIQYRAQVDPEDSQEPTCREMTARRK